MALIRDGTSQLPLEKLFLTKKEYLKLCRLSQIVSQEQHLRRPNVQKADNSAQYFSRGHASMKNFLRIIDPGFPANLALIPGAQRTGCAKVLAALSTELPSPEANFTEMENLPRDGHSSCKVYFIGYLPEFQYSTDFKADPVAFWVACLEKYDYPVPSALTFNLTLALLEDGYARTSPKDGNLAYHDFAMMTTAIALDRLLARFDLGAKQRNFMHYLTLLLNSVGHSDAFGPDVAALRSKSADSRLHSDVDTASWWPEEKLNLLWLLAKHEVIPMKCYSQQLRFDSKARRFIYLVLSLLLQDGAPALSQANICRPSKETRAAFCKEDYREALLELSQAIDRLSLFVRYLGEEITCTLRWIAHVCKLKQRVPGRTRSSSRELAGLEDIEMDPDCGWHDGVLYWLHLFVADFDAVRGSHRWAVYGERNPKHAARQAKLAAKAQPHTVTVDLSAAMQARLPTMDEVLDEVLTIPGHGAALYQRLVARNANLSAEEAQTTYAMHPEAILLSLRALIMGDMFSAPGDPAPTPKQISACLKSQNIDIPGFVINEFRHPGEIMAMSQRCCPGCRTLLDHVHHWQSGVLRGASSGLIVTEPGDLSHYHHGRRAQSAYLSFGLSRRLSERLRRKLITVRRKSGC